MTSIERLSSVDLDHRSRVVLDWYDASVGDRPRAIPVLDICARLDSIGKLRLVLDVELGVGPSGRKIRGMFEAEKRLIAIDRSLHLGGPQFLFTLAHELAHFVLHRNYPLTEMNIDASNATISDTRWDLYMGRKSTRVTQRDWMEWQANTFAEALLLPELSLRKTVIAIQRDMGINKHLGAIYINRTPQSRSDYRAIVARVQTHFHVSRTIVVRRLWRLGIIMDLGGGLKHTSRLFAEDSQTHE